MEGIFIYIDSLCYINYMSKEHHVIFNYNQITDSIFLGSNLCCTNPTHTGILKKEGISADIDLEIERQGEVPEVEVYLWLPVVDRTAPTIIQLETGVAAIDSLVKRSEKIYVHCKKGHSRSTTLVAAYFVSKGMTPDEAIAKIKLKRDEIHLQDVQLEVLRQYHNDKL